MTDTDQNDLMTPAEVSAVLRRPLGTLRQWRHRGYGPRPIRLGGSVVYRRSAVEAFVRECEAGERGPDAA